MALFNIKGDAIAQFRKNQSKRVFKVKNAIHGIESFRIIL